MSELIKEVATSAINEVAKEAAEAPIKEVSVAEQLEAIRKDALEAGQAQDEVKFGERDLSTKTLFVDYASGD